MKFIDLCLLSFIAALRAATKDATANNLEFILDTWNMLIKIEF